MKIKTSKGKTFDVVTAFGPISTGELVIRMYDDRPLSDVAVDFDGCDYFRRESETEGDIDFDGYSVLTGINRDYHGTGKKIIIITISKKEGR